LAFIGLSTAEVSANKKTHSASSQILMSNVHYVYNQLVDKESAETIGGVKTYTSYPKISTYVAPTADEEFATKKYIDDTAIAGSPKASASVFGVSRLSSLASTTNPTALSLEEVATTTGANKVVRASSTGKIDPSFLNGTDNYTFNGNSTFNGTTTANGRVDGITKFGGTGADGALTITSGTTTINLAGSPLVVKNYSSISITGTGVLMFSNPHANGSVIILRSKGNVIITSTALSGAIDISNLGGSGGASGSGGTNGMAVNNVLPRAGTQPATGGAGVGGTGGDFSNGLFYGSYPLFAGAGGAGGYTASYACGAGGKGAGGLVIEAKGSYQQTGIIYAAGNNGGNSPGSQNTSGRAGGGGGAGRVSGSNGGAYSYSGSCDLCGGGGGGGGSVIVLYDTYIATGTINVAGGVGGSSACNCAGGNGGDGFKYIGQNINY
jgi:hypothetical protein